MPVLDSPAVTFIITTVDSARDLGVTLDSHLTMSAHVSSMCRSTYSFLRQLRPVVRSLTEDAAKTVVHAFISMRLDYCNSLLCGIFDTLLRRLQSVQNAAARVITRTQDVITLRRSCTTLATSATASGVQACCSGVQGTEQPSTRILLHLPLKPGSDGPRARRRSAD